jgi:hypothetical protein
VLGVIGVGSGMLRFRSGANFEVFRNDADGGSLRIEWSLLWVVRGGDREVFIPVSGFFFLIVSK